MGFFFCLSLALVSLSIYNSSSSKVDVPIGVILDISSTDSPVGYFGYLALSISRHDFYSQHADYKTRLVLKVRDSNGSVIGAAAAALDLMKNEDVEAIIGPQKSTQVNFVMDIGDRAHVPIISFSATSPSLVPRTPYFVRTVQSDANQVLAIASIVKAYQWGQVVIIYEDTEFGNGIMPYLSNALQDVNARVSYRTALPISVEDDHIAQELYKIMTMQTRVFIVHTTQSLGKKLFLKANELGMMKKGYAWIVTSGLTDLFNVSESDVVEAMQGVLGVRPVVPNSPQLLSFSNRFSRALLQSNKDITFPSISIFSLLAYDTFHALAFAVESVWNTESVPKKDKENHESTDPFVVPFSQIGQQLLESLLDTNFIGLTGVFNLKNGQLAQTSYQIVNVVGREERQVGIWTLPGASTSKESFKSIIWPGDTTTAPRGWEVPIGGQKLRIGVPQKPGFNEFLKVEVDPQANATKVSGYYKDIFEDVIAALPYALPFEYFAYPFYDSNNSKVGCYDDLVHQVSLQDPYDVALGDITITANRSAFVDFSLPFAQGGVTGIVPIKYEDVNDVFTFLKPLTIELWMTTAVFYLSTALAIWIIGSRAAMSSTKESPGEHAAMIAYFPLFPGQGMEASLLCVVLVTWAFIASLLNSTYTASLSSRLTVARLQPAIEVTELIKKGHFVGCQEGSFLVSFLLNLGFDGSKIKTYKSAEACVEALSLGSEDGGISAYYDVMPHIRLLVSQYCGNYRMLDPVYRTDGFGIAFPKASPLVADISRAIIQLTEKGIIQEIEQQLMTNPSCSGPDSANPPTRVTLRSFMILFVITGCVTLTCLMVLLLKYLHQKVSFCERMLRLNTYIRSNSRIMYEFLKLIKP